MPTRPKTKILALDPGTREMGMAYLEDDDLVDYGVKTVRAGPKPNNVLLRVESIVTRLIKEKQPDVLVLEKNQFSHIRQNYLLTLAVVKIKSLAKRLGVPLVEYAPNTVRKAVCGDGTATKRQLARVVVARYPVLKPYLESNRLWRIRYFQNLYDAVAVGLTYRAAGRKYERY